MSGRELPQPIYPTPPPGPTGGPAPGPVSPGPMSPGPAAPTPGPGAPGSGDPGPTAPRPSGSTPPWLGDQRILLIAGAAIIGLLIVAVVAIALLQDDGDTGGNNAGPNSLTNPGNTNSADPGSGNQATTDRDRVMRVAEVQILAASAGTVSCIADGLQGAPDLFAIIENQTMTGVQLHNAGDASRYARIITGCATPEELTTAVSSSFVQGGATAGQIGCLEDELWFWGQAEWEEYVMMIVQPSRAFEMTNYLVEVVSFC